MEVKVHGSAPEVADAVASLVAESVRASANGLTLGLAGGSSPEATYRALRDFQVDWESVTAWMTDERWVAHTSPRSNGHMAIEALFGGVPADLLRPVYDPEAGPDWSAQQYETSLTELFDETGPGLALLGMGADGHTASLFPGSDALDETERWYVANTIPETGERRLTASYPLLHRIPKLVLIVVGESKAAALRDSLDGTTPAGRLGGGEGEVVWHVDKAAAALL